MPANGVSRDRTRIVEYSEDQPPARLNRDSRRLFPTMLVLSRKKNESIVVNSDIVITVVEIRGDKVRLGIVAPKDVPVHREEVYQAIHGHSPVKPAVETTGAN